jgi:hypothetical protein
LRFPITAIKRHSLSGSRDISDSGNSRLSPSGDHHRFRNVGPPLSLLLHPSFDVVSYLPAFLVRARGTLRNQVLQEVFMIRTMQLLNRDALQACQNGQFAEKGFLPGGHPCFLMHYAIVQFELVYEVGQR